MDKTGVNISITGNKFKVLIGLIIAIGSIQTYILADRQVTHSEMVHVLDSLHHRQLLFTHQERNSIVQKIDLSRIEQEQKIEKLLIEPLDGVMNRLTVLETRINDRIGAAQNETARQGVMLKWQLYQMEHKIDSLPAPVILNIRKDEIENIPNRANPARIRN